MKISKFGFKELSGVHVYMEDGFSSSANNLHRSELFLQYAEYIYAM